MCPFGSTKDFDLDLDQGTSGPLNFLIIALRFGKQAMGSARFVAFEGKQLRCS